MMNGIHTTRIARELGVPAAQVEATGLLLAEGATVSAREVEHVIRSEAAGTPGMPPPYVAPTAGAVRPYLPAQSHDRQQIEQALAQTHGNKSRAAQMLGLTLRQLNYRIKRLEMA
jgi:Nif-specific regulatory protein